MTPVPPAVSERQTSTQTSSQPELAEDLLILDAHTFKDLEIFESESGEQSLYDYCNLARTRGGARVLRQRMEHPWSNPGRINATQESLSFILAQRQAFSMLPSAYATSRAEHYTREVLPIVTHENPIEFSLDAFALWANNDSHYFNIVRGVQRTCGMIRKLRSFISQAELASPVGEIAPLLEEMQGLLAHSKLAKVPDQELSGWAFRILRIDQVFRLHEKSAINRLLQLIYEIDALVAMADATRNYGFVLPRIEEGSLGVHAEGLVHPFISEAVANPVKLDQQSRVLFLTGPNMAGKTTYIRAFATALYLAHLGMGVPANSFRFVPAQRLFSSISLNDDLRSGVSYFRAEALRVKAVAQAVADGLRVVALIDEPFKGTNVKDALDASLSILQRFATRQDCLFMFSSHLIEIGEALSTTEHIDCRNFEADENEGNLRFDYRLHPGVSSQRLGMRVLREEGIFELLDEISDQDQ